MPVISAFYGMIIRMFHDDHNPPHIHIQYGDKETLIEIRTGKLLKGSFSSRQKKLIEDWRKLHKNELLKAWDDCQALKQPKKIKPLE